MRNRRLIQSATLVAAFAVACLGAGVGTARAGDVTLELSGNVNPGGFNVSSCAAAGCMLGGTIEINNTTGAFVSADITMSGETPAVGPFTNDGATFANGSETVLSILGPSDDSVFLSFTTTTPGSLVGYDGGALSTAYSYVQIDIGNSYYPAWDLTSGSLTPTPEPSSWMLSAVMLGLGALLLSGQRFRLRRAAD